MFFVLDSAHVDAENVCALLYQLANGFLKWNQKKSDYQVACIFAKCRNNLGLPEDLVWTLVCH